MKTDILIVGSGCEGLYEEVTLHSDEQRPRSREG